MDTTTSSATVADGRDRAARPERDRLVARLAWVSALAALLIAPLHALARYRTEDGAEDLDIATTRFWAEPAGDLLSPLLTWGDPDLVYVTYGKLWLPVFVLFTAAAFVAYRQRAPRGFEKGAWRVVLFGYCGACVSVLGEYWTQWTDEANALLDIVFLVSIPFVLLTMLGSTVLGITLLVKGYRPRLAAVLVACAVPGLVVIPEFLSLGSIVLPLAFGWAVAARHLR
jgi:hypothetical protein